jgi:hypothetical protein
MNWKSSPNASRKVSLTLVQCMGGQEMKYYYNKISPKNEQSINWLTNEHESGGKVSDTNLAFVRRKMHQGCPLLDTNLAFVRRKMHQGCPLLSHSLHTNNQLI